MTNSQSVELLIAGSVELRTLNHDVYLSMLDGLETSFLLFSFNLGFPDYV